MKDKGKEAARFSLKSLNNKRGFTLFEVIVVAFIMFVLLGGLAATLQIANLSTTVNSNKIYLQSYLRNIMNMITKDVRQTDIIEINSNSPSTDHIKFRRVTGIDNTTGQYSVDPNYIEYSYNGTLDQLIRNELDAAGSVLSSRVFNNITQSPFYTAPGVALVETAGVPGNILIAKKLLIVVSGQKQVQNSLTLNFTLTEETKIRNE